MRDYEKFFPNSGKVRLAVDLSAAIAGGRSRHVTAMRNIGLRVPNHGWDSLVYVTGTMDQFRTAGLGPSAERVAREHLGPRHAPDIGKPTENGGAPIVGEEESLK